MRRIYAAVITPPETGEKYYLVHIPDLDLYTQGIDVADAIYMARDCIGIWGITQQDNNLTIPEAKTLSPVAQEGEIVTLVDIDFDKYRKENDNRAVRKNCTIPAWLDKEATARHINFSQVLQEALKQQLSL